MRDVSSIGEKTLDSLYAPIPDCAMERRASVRKTRSTERLGVHFHLVGICSVIEEYLEYCDS